MSRLPPQPPTPYDHVPSYECVGQGRLRRRFEAREEGGETRWVREFRVHFHRPAQGRQTRVLLCL
jgi:hypothetical protein